MIATEFYFGRGPTFPDFGNINKLSFVSKKRIEISSLRPNQHEVDQDEIELKRKGKRLQDIYVVNHKGENYLMDGHHTVIAKMLNGQKYVTAYYLIT